ncbi:PH, RCC1 and FYVE domains-containing protein 1-like isoform X2 [Malus sylvestris]|uniref:PH, RCC1 and FYVE domains-containing protein 1-like isoform X2 n=1 Tax=Malus sylvestris TaxID=3752 RepID=UPI0021AC473B|nr:PH, RCC1 and FYVE domains-containing protein 1-like isoform X2 [Malus sylvestris]
MKALIALKKGSQLIKYSRKGKPKLRPFRISTDETTLIWYSHGEERTPKLASVSRIISGQRTNLRRWLWFCAVAVMQLRPSRFTIVTPSLPSRPPPPHHRCRKH